MNEGWHVDDLPRVRGVSLQLPLASTSVPTWPFNKPNGVDPLFAEKLPSSNRSIDDRSDLRSFQFYVESFLNCFSDFVCVERSTMFQQNLSNHLGLRHYAGVTL